MSTEFLLVDDVKVNHNLLVLGSELSVLHSDTVKHPLSRYRVRLFRVLIRHVDNFLDLGLNDDLGALITREQSHIESASFHIEAVLVQNCVYLGMTHVHVLVLQVDLWSFRPRKRIIWAADRKTIVPNTHYFLLGVYNTSSDLCSRIFATSSGQKGDRHEIFFPFQVVLALTARSLLRDMEFLEVGCCYKTIK